MGNAGVARIVTGAVLLAILVASMPVESLVATAATTTTYTAVETIPVPPASAYGGSGGGDGWGIALSADRVYNVFHHSSQLQVACHLQSDASQCWTPETITDPSGDNFATSGQPGLWLDQTSAHLYVYATRTSDSTGGVVCIDTASASTNQNPFCGFTALTAIGAAPTFQSISFISDPMRVGTHWYAFNFVNDVAASSTQNNLLCFDLTNFSACASQPFTIGIGAGTVSDGSFPPPATAVIGGTHLIIPIRVGTTDEVACFDATALANCNGSWPVLLGFSYDSAYGAPFPMMTSTGTSDGFCFPTGTDPCFDFTGAAVATPAGMASVITATSGWNGPALVLGPRVYIPDGNTDQVECFDYSTGASCNSFPKTLSNLGLLYTVNSDPQRPTCVWVNSDNGADQIQNFDAYTAGACGQGPIRVLASSLVVNTQLCVPSTYTSLQVLSPPPSAYSSGTVSIEDGDANLIAGAPTLTLDATGSVSLTGLSLNTAQGLPQFLITLSGAATRPTSVTVQLTWTGVSDPSCTPAGTPPPTTLLPFRSTYSHQQVLPGAERPQSQLPGFQDPTYNASAWTPAQAPFGTRFGIGNGQFECAIDSGANAPITPWDSYSDMLLRAQVYVPASIAGFHILRVIVRLSGGVEVYWNGTPIGFKKNRCASTSDAEFVVTTQLVLAGPNLLALRGVGGDPLPDNYLDASVIVDDRVVANAGCPVGGTDQPARPNPHDQFTYADGAVSSTINLGFPPPANSSCHGVLYIDLFISVPVACPSPLFHVQVFCLKGNDRGFDEFADISRSKVRLALDVQSGVMTLWAEPTCDDKGTCHSALSWYQPTCDFINGSTPLIGCGAATTAIHDKENWILAYMNGNSIQIEISAKQAAVPAPREVGADILDEFSITPNPGWVVNTYPYPSFTITGNGDDFPSAHIYQEFGDGATRTYGEWREAATPNCLGIKHVNDRNYAVSGSGSCVA